MQGALRFFEDGRVVAGSISYRQVMEGNVVMVMLQGRRRRQNHVGMPSRLIQSWVDRDHELQRLQSVIQCSAIWGREHGVTRTRKHQSNLSLSGRRDLIHHCHRGQFVVELRQASASAGETPEATGVRIHYLVHRRQRKQATARLIQMPCYNVNHLNSPLTKGSKSLRTHAHASVTNASLGIGKLMSDPDDIDRIDAC